MPCANPKKHSQPPCPAWPAPAEGQDLTFAFWRQFGLEQREVRSVPTGSASRPGVHGCRQRVFSHPAAGIEWGEPEPLWLRVLPGEPSRAPGDKGQWHQSPSLSTDYRGSCVTSLEPRAPSPEAGPGEMEPLSSCCWIPLGSWGAGGGGGSTHGRQQSLRMVALPPEVSHCWCPSVGQGQQSVHGSSRGQHPSSLGDGPCHHGPQPTPGWGKQAHG